MARIILVEDDELIIDIASDALSAAGHLVTAVSDGAAAHDAVRAAVPDAVVLDCGLPGRSGMAVLRLLKTDPDTARIPVMMLTARRSSWHLGVARAEGASDYLSKPFEPCELVSRVEQLVHGDGAA